eukprot:GHRQ01027202.1.p1 GENE.GHRQ01027202.1~~GHRQ01027202.1.p1  ORF type:complete len:179 (-),score=16.79 GHRQ01027202.1:628-1164(-)
MQQSIKIHDIWQPLLGKQRYGGRMPLLLAGRPTPSVACIVQPGSNGGFQKVFFGDEEIAIPVYGRCVQCGCMRAPCKSQQQQPRNSRWVAGSSFCIVPRLPKARLAHPKRGALHAQRCAAKHCHSRAAVVACINTSASRELLQDCCAACMCAELPSSSTSSSVASLAVYYPNMPCITC